MKDIEYTIRVYTIDDDSLDEANGQFDFTFINRNNKLPIDEIIWDQILSQMKKHPGLRHVDSEVINISLVKEKT